MANGQQQGGFYGWKVARAAFVLAAVGWGIGFYGPPIFLATIMTATGWPLTVVSAAVTAHFLVGAVVAAMLPGLHRRLGAARTTAAGAGIMLAGALAWSVCAAPWQLFGAAVLTGAGWGSLGAAALNALLSPWFVRTRPAALGLAYNGASVGGVVFAPLWVGAIEAMGFPLAAMTIASTAALVVWILAARIFSLSPRQMGLQPDGCTRTLQAPSAAHPLRVSSGALLWRDRRFLTLCAGITLGLFAQIGLTSQLFSILSPALGAHRAGIALSFMTAMAIAGRALIGWLLPHGADRRLVAGWSYGVQALGCLILSTSCGSNTFLLIGGIALFGLGFGNATSLPPLIVQSEFDEAEVQRVVALAIGCSQGCYAFAPALFGWLRDLVAAAGLSPWAPAAATFLGCMLVQAGAIGAFLLGRKPRRDCHQPGRNPNTRSKRGT